MICGCQHGISLCCWDLSDVPPRSVPPECHCHVVSRGACMLDASAATGPACAPAMPYNSRPTPVPACPCSPVLPPAVEPASTEEVYRDQPLCWQPRGHRLQLQRGQQQRDAARGAICALRTGHCGTSAALQGRCSLDHRPVSACKAAVWMIQQGTGFRRLPVAQSACSGPKLKVDNGAVTSAQGCCISEQSSCRSW